MAFQPAHDVALDGRDKSDMQICMELCRKNTFASAAGSTSARAAPVKHFNLPMTLRSQCTMT